MKHDWMSKEELTKNKWKAGKKGKHHKKEPRNALE